MHDSNPQELAERLEDARVALLDAERQNAAATLSRREPPYSSDQIRELEYAVADIAEEMYGGDLLAVGPHAQRMTFPAVS